MNTFYIKASQEEQLVLAEAVPRWGVVVNKEKSEATLKDRSGAEFTFEPVDNKDEIKVTVVQNPAHVFLEDVQAILEHNIKTILTTCKTESVGESLWLRALRRLHWLPRRVDVPDEQNHCS
jgi:hypothetical protein